MFIFFIWALFGLVPIGLGIYAFNSSKAIDFWANMKTTQDVSDIKAYNRALARLWWVFAIIFILLGLPLLLDQKSALAIIIIPGVMLDCIFLMAMLRKIEIKYKT